MVNSILLRVCCLSCGVLAINVFAAEPQPEIELLEFIAEMESDRGQWLDPVRVSELAGNELIEPNDDRQNVEQGNDE